MFVRQQSAAHLKPIVPLFMAAFFAAPLFSQTNVLTYHNDNARTGQNLTEITLTTQNVRSTSFGKLFMVAVDGKVDAQPLYVSGLTIPGRGTHNVVFAATEHDSVYAFDAENGTVYWQVSILNPGETTSDPRNCNQVAPEIGITATPVIDLTAGASGTIYVVGMSKDAAGNYFHRLHALDLVTGAEQFGGPVLIAGTYPGVGENSVAGNVVFDAKQYKDRPGLLLLNGTVYTSWGSHCDIGAYTGWSMGYDHATLQQNSIFNFAPNGSDGAPWNAGSGPAADAQGNIFYSLGNGTFDTTLNAQNFPVNGNYGNSFVKLSSANNQLTAIDYWTMSNTVTESNADVDLGSGGIMLLPDLTDAAGNIRHLAVGAGKDKNLYVLDRENMGKFDPVSDATIYQELDGALAVGIWSNPAYFNGHVYFGAVSDYIRSFSITNARFSMTPVSMTANVFGYPGASPSISANGITNPILWAVENKDAAVLHAYDANDLGIELYNSDQAAAGRDQLGPGNKFITPMIANGKVFVGTTNGVAVFGLLDPTQAAAPSRKRSHSSGNPVGHSRTHPM